MRDRPYTSTVLVADLVQHQPLAVVEADPHPPPLPAKLVAFERERRAVGLADLERPQIVAESQTRNQLRPVLAHHLRQPRVIDVLQLEQLHAVDVDDRPQAPDVVRIRIRLLAAAHPHVTPRDPAVAVGGRDQRLGVRPRVDEHQVEVVDPTARERSDHVGMTANQLVALVVLLAGEVRLHAWPLADVRQLVGAQIDRAFVDQAVATIPDHGPRLARDVSARLQVSELGLRGLDQLDARESPLLAARVTPSRMIATAREISSARSGSSGCGEVGIADIAAQPVWSVRHRTLRQSRRSASAGSSWEEDHCAPMRAERRRSPESTIACPRRLVGPAPRSRASRRTRASAPAGRAS